MVPVRYMVIRCDQLVLDRLDTTLDFSSFRLAFRYLIDDCLIIKRLTTGSYAPAITLSADLLAADVYKRSQMGQSKGLSAVLVAGYLCNDLCRYTLHAVKKLCGFSDHVSR